MTVQHPDARMWAWLQSWDHLEAATKMQEKYPDRDITDVLDQLHRAAGLYAELAAVSERVGVEAGTAIVERRRVEEQKKAMLKNFVEEAVSRD